MITLRLYLSFRSALGQHLISDGHSEGYFGGLLLATHKSAEKRARQSVKRNSRNSTALNAVRTFEKKLRTALAGNDKTAATTLLNDYMSKMMKAATRGVVHAKTASRKISRLSERVSKLS